MGVSIRRETFDSIQQSWEDVLPSCVTDTIFVTPWWQRTWWDNFGGEQTQHILSVSEGDTLLGIAPLMSQDARLTFLGDRNLSDYFDFIVPADSVSRFYPALTNHLSDMEWRTLDLPSLPAGSPTLEHLPILAESLGWHVDVEEDETTPKAALPDTWDEFLAGLRKKDRHELRRKLRRLEREDSHRQYAAEKQGLLDGPMDDFFRLLRASREDKNEFLTADREQFFLDIARESVSRDQFRLYFLEVGGERVAACICFDYGDDYLLYNSGYDPSYSRLSVGLINKALSVQTAIGEGRKVFNFLKGNERYKYHLGGQDEAVFNLTITRG